MTPGTIQLATAALIFLLPLVLLGIAALTFGVDSRPGIDDRGPHRWTPGS